MLRLSRRFWTVIKSWYAAAALARDAHAQRELAVAELRRVARERNDLAEKLSDAEAEAKMLKRQLDDTDGKLEVALGQLEWFAEWQSSVLEYQKAEAAIQAKRRTVALHKAPGPDDE